MYGSNLLHFLVEIRQLFYFLLSNGVYGKLTTDEQYWVIPTGSEFICWCIEYVGVQTSNSVSEKQKSIYELTLRSSDTSHWLSALVLSYISTHYTILKQFSFPKNQPVLAKESIILELGCITKYWKQPALNDFGSDEMFDLDYGIRDIWWWNCCILKCFHGVFTHLKNNNVNW